MYKERCSSLVCAITYVGPVLSYLTQQTCKGHGCVQNPGIILFVILYMLHLFSWRNESLHYTDFFMHPVLDQLLTITTS